MFNDFLCLYFLVGSILILQKYEFPLIYCISLLINYHVTTTAAFLNCFTTPSKLKTSVTTT